MQRKIACYLTAAVTVLFMVLRTVIAVSPSFLIVGISAEDVLIGASLVVMAVVAVLCFSKRAVVNGLGSSPLQPTIGWIATFSGAILAMYAVLEGVCWLFPKIGYALFHDLAANQRILNNVDLYSLIFSIVFGVLSGIYLIVQGFMWMSQSAKKTPWLSWMSLCPVIWMWFRLARYEISYASTIDISHSFFDFAVLVTASLFFLQLAKMLSDVQAAPKNLLIIFSLFTSLSSLSGLPLLVIGFMTDTSITTLLIAIIDAAVGLLSFFVALTQINAISDEVPTEAEYEDETEDSQPESDEASMAWTTPAKQRRPLDPPFYLDEILPVLDEKPQMSSAAPSADDAEDKPLTVDDILAELNLSE